MNKYGDKVKEHGRYPYEIAVAMGDEFYFGVFDNLKEALEFKDYIYQA